MKRYSKKHIVAKLKLEGLAFSEFSLAHEGPYSIEDADWNYKDVPHLHHIHELVEAIFTSVEDDHIATINMQKVFGIKLPLAVFNYQTEANAQTYYTTWFFFVLIVETRYEQIAALRTRVTTTYTIGSPKILQWTFPILRWILKKNYDNLMSGDIPMRERRGQLRSWGYSFKKDKPLYSFEETMDIRRNNVVAPETAVPQDLTIDIRQKLPADGELLVGESNHHGVRLIRRGNELVVFPRMCPHEGACLDKQNYANQRINCPWHGRIFTPLGTFDLSDDNAQKAQLESCLLALDRGSLSVSFKRTNALKQR